MFIVPTYAAATVAHIHSVHSYAEKIHWMAYPLVVVNGAKNKAWLRQLANIVPCVASSYKHGALCTVCVLLGERAGTQ
jgi:hypothetical protein